MTISNIFIDGNELFDDTDLKTEDFLQDLIQRTVFPEVGTIINVPENNVVQATQREFQSKVQRCHFSRL